MDTGLERRGGPLSPGPSADGPAGEREERRDRPRILFVSKTAEATGPTTSLTLLLDRLSRAYEVGVLVQGTGPFCEVLKQRGLPHWGVPSLEGREVPAILRFLRRHRFSLIYANETSRASRNVCLVGRLLGVPFVSHVRSMGWRHGWLRLGHLRVARSVVAVSHACGQSVARFTSPGRLHVIHNGVPEGALIEVDPQRRARTRRELGLGDETRMILNVSHLSPRKGQLHAVAALGRVLEQNLQAHLVLVGATDRDPGYVEQIRQAARAPELSGKVSVLGFRSDIPHLLEAADILLHTALADPHPRAVIEGMAAGLPVVAFATDGVTETVADGRTGFLVEREDEAGLAAPLVQLIDHPELRQSFGAAGRARVRDGFLEGHTAEKVAGVVETALTGKRHSA